MIACGKIAARELLESLLVEDATGVADGDTAVGVADKTSIAIMLKFFFGKRCAGGFGGDGWMEGAGANR